VPNHFQFAVKLPKVATHDRRLVDAEDVLDSFLGEATQLREKLGALLVQLPPSLSFIAQDAEKFFASLRDRFDGNVALEPRHASWFGPKADKVVTKFRVARIAVDPALVVEAAVPGCWDGIVYYRLHGSPRMYYSAYSPEYLEDLSKTLLEAARSAPVWCIFDNTAEGAATVDALNVLARLREG
jgi:uncharacterized protein YecE (DUF72 family)